MNSYLGSGVKVYLRELDGTNSAAFGFRVNFVFFELGLELVMKEGI